MPIYEYACGRHGKFEGWALVSARHEAQKCPRCGFASPFVISAPRVFSDYPGYISPATGEWVEGRKARLDDLAKSGCRPYETGEVQDQQRRAAAAERELDQQVDSIVEQAFTEIKNG